MWVAAAVAPAEAVIETVVVVVGLAVAVAVDSVVVDLVEIVAAEDWIAAAVVEHRLDYSLLRKI